MRLTAFLWPNGVRRVRSGLARPTHTTALLLAAALILCPLVFAQDVASVNWRDLPYGVRSAKDKYDDQAAKIEAVHAKAVRTADKTRQDAMKQALKPLEAAIDKAVKKAMASEDLDLAVALRQAKESLAAEPSVEQMLIGVWKAEWTTGGRGTITFEKSGKAHTAGTHATGGWDTKGRWRLTDTHVVAEWDNKLPSGDPTWEALRLPLTTDGIVIGDTWHGLRTLRAKKVK